MASTCPPPCRTPCSRGSTDSHRRRGSPSSPPPSSARASSPRSSTRCRTCRRRRRRVRHRRDAALRGTDVRLPARARASVGAVRHHARVGSAPCTGRCSTGCASLPMSPRPFARLAEHAEMAGDAAGDPRVRRRGRRLGGQSRLAPRGRLPVRPGDALRRPARRRRADRSARQAGLRVPGRRSARGRHRGVEPASSSCCAPSRAHPGGRRRAARPRRVVLHDRRQQSTGRRSSTRPSRCSTAPAPVRTSRARCATAARSPPPGVGERGGRHLARAGARSWPETSAPGTSRPGLASLGLTHLLPARRQRAGDEVHARACGSLWTSATRTWPGTSTSRSRGSPGWSSTSPEAHARIEEAVRYTADHDLNGHLMCALAPRSP